ncbi:protein EMSY-LIKE 3-like isoform X1 [Iris pallida]|uniref:Protein EMSY-LIKE 3-like isoform X1 n=1 Tax=Iris pallida TaxID=29817 RepID=A0AAX6GMD3_IRIPA|nr:protein EMSY-LIKE 3-like isoform X1 [Iris pallida]
MEYGPSDSSGTDDDLPPSHQNQVGAREVITGNGKPPVGCLPYPRVQNDMETQIHRLEQEAYSSVLRAFKAQSDAITWEKESLITELRKELRVSDDEHRELLSRVNADGIIQRIREWRQTGGLQSGMLNSAQPAHDQVPSPSISASRKRKTSQSIPSLTLGAPTPSLHSQPVTAPVEPSSSAVKRGTAAGAKGKKGPTLPCPSAEKSLPYSSTGPSARGPVANRSATGALAQTEPAETAAGGPLIGRKVRTRWPEDDSFYEAVITAYKPLEGKHLLVYDINTTSETWEWVNLKEISSEDIQWEGDDPGLSQRVGRAAPGHGVKNPTGRGGTVPSAGRGRGSLKNHSKKTFPSSQNGIGKKGLGDIEILHTDILVKEVERVYNTSHFDPMDIEKAKKLLKDHEQSLIDAIRRLADASDGESEEDDQQFSHDGRSNDRDQGWRNQQCTSNQHGANYDDGMAF